MLKILKCRTCGRALIRIGEDGIVKASGVVVKNIQGDAPKAGDIFKFTCKCGFHIIGLTPDYLVEQKS